MAILKPRHRFQVHPCKLGHYPAIGRLDLTSTWVDTSRMRVGALMWLMTLLARGNCKVGTGPQQVVPQPAPAAIEIKLPASEIELHTNSKTLIDWTLSQLVRYDYLRRPEPSSNRDQPPDILDCIGRACTHLLHAPSIMNGSTIPLRRRSPSSGAETSGCFLPAHGVLARWQ
jgi:hypothetical protein